MTDCPKCGTENEDDAKYCKNCGAPLNGTQKNSDKKWGEECPGGPRYASYIWGLILILIGLWILLEFVLRDIPGIPAWVYAVDFGLLFALVIGIAIIIAGIRSILKKD